MEIEEYKKLLERHDWHYAMSDDGRVYRQGEAADRKIKSIAVSSDDHRRAFNEAHEQIYNHDTWHATRPYRWPYPEVMAEPPPPTVSGELERQGFGYGNGATVPYRLLVYEDATKQKLVGRFNLYLKEGGLRASDSQPLPLEPHQVLECRRPPKATA